MADLGNITALKSAIAAVLNNGVADESIEPDDHNQLLVNFIDTAAAGNVVTKTSIGLSNVPNTDFTSAVALNTAKETNATHTGEVLGDTTLTLDSTAISNKTSLGALAGTEEVLVNDAGTLKKVPTSLFGSSGKVAIYDANGKPTFYSTLDAGNSAAVSGDTVTLFTDIYVTTAFLLKTGVDYNLNGYSIINQEDTATDTVSTTTGSYTGTIYNGKIVRTGRANGSSGYAFRVQNLAGTTEIFFRGVEVTNTYGVGFYSALNGGLIEGLNAKAYSTAISSQSQMRFSYGFSTVGTGIEGFNSCVLYSCIGFSVSSSAVKVPLSYNTIGLTVSGNGVFDGGSHVNAIANGSSAAGFYVVGDLDNCIGRSAATFAAINTGNITGGSYYSNTVSAVASCSSFINAYAKGAEHAVTILPNGVCSNSTLISTGIYAPIRCGNANPKIINNTIINTGTGDGIDASGATGTVIVADNYIDLADGTKSAILGTASGRAVKNVFSTNITTPINANFTQLTTNTPDAQGNIKL